MIFFILTVQRNDTSQHPEFEAMLLLAVLKIRNEKLDIQK